MILDIVKFGHPALREKGQRIEQITAELRKLAADMLETMYAADGVGLAAHQIGKPVLLTVIDVSPSEQPWTISPPLPMPLVLINPELSNPTGEQTSTEGCLSIPEVSAQIRRAERITVRARTLDDKEIVFEATGLLARAAQHEVDHLNGVLFVDRMDAATRASVAGKLKKLHKETLAGLQHATRRRAPLAKM